MNLKLMGTIVITNGQKETRLEGLDIEVAQAQPDHVGALFEHLFNSMAGEPAIETQKLEEADTNGTNVGADSEADNTEAAATSKKVENKTQAVRSEPVVEEPKVKATIKTKKIVELRPKQKATPETEVVETVVQETETSQAKQEFEEGWEEYMREKKRKKKRFSPIRNAKRKLIQLLEDDEE